MQEQYNSFFIQQHLHVFRSYIILQLPNSILKVLDNRYTFSILNIEGILRSIYLYFSTLL